MTILILFALVLAALLVDYIVQIRQFKIQPIPAAKPVALQKNFLPDGIFSSRGHVWGMLMPSGQINLGVNPLVAQMVGKIDQVIVPNRGKTIAAGQSLFEVVQGDRRLQIQSPVSGVVEEINPLVLANAETIKRDVHKAWTVSLKPPTVTDALKAMFIGEEARQWIANEMKRLRDFFALRSAQPELALVMQDGGMPAEGILQTMDQTTWRQFEDEFLNVQP